MKSSPHSKSKEFLSSDSDSNDNSSPASTKGNNTVQKSKKRSHSISSSSVSSLSLSDSESESVNTSSKKKKTTDSNVKNVNTFKQSDELDMAVSDSDSDVSSIISEVVESVKTVTPGPSKPLPDSKTPIHKKKDEEAIQGTWKKSTGKNKWKYEYPEDFVVDSTDKSLTQKDIKGKQLYVITMPADLDLSLLNGQSINMNGTSNINVETDQTEKQFEVIAAKYPKGMKKHNSVVKNDEGNYKLDTQVTGYIDVLPWIPLPPPIVFNKTKPKKHTIPDNLPYKLRPFGADSPPRTQDICEDSIVEESTHKHKKKKKHKSKS